MNFGLRCGFVVDIIIYDTCDGYCDVYDACCDIYDACDGYCDIYVMSMFFGAAHGKLTQNGYRNRRFAVCQRRHTIN
jgi:hypothetical protein